MRAGVDSVQGDPLALKSVLINLFVNAADVMNEAEAREDIFKPFFSTKKGGTGLGLSLAARIVEEHRGTLKLAEPQHSNHGAAFVVELSVPSKERNT